jgi:hypothetical protein
MAEKIYVPKSGAKLVEFNNGGSLIRTMFHAETLIDWLKDQLESGEHVSEKGYISINVIERRAPSEYGQTHYLSLDTWKPSPKGGKKALEEIPF